MKTYLYPDPSTLRDALQRPNPADSGLRAAVSSIFDDVQRRGDEALCEYSLRFDGYEPPPFYVTEKEFDEAEKALTPELKKAIQIASKNIEMFHKSQVEKPQKIETAPGVWCWRRAVGLEQVGLYAPGGTAPLFSSVLMLGIPARIAGCREITLATPCSSKNGTGSGNTNAATIHPAILYAASCAGIKRVLKLGGAHAIAAFALGTDHVARVDKIFGPGNAYVTAAKQIAQSQGTGIDMPAGPSELMVVADSFASPVFVAADLLSQAEHGIDSQVIFCTSEATLLPAVEEEISRQLPLLPRRDIAREALSHARFVLVEVSDIQDVINQYAPEHLILNTKSPEALAEKVIHAGSVFLGAYTPESLGDYASGTNHTLPTHGYARQYSGVSVDSFVRKITFQMATEEGLRGLGPVVETMAEAEQLHGHKQAVEVRYTKKDRPDLSSPSASEFTSASVHVSKKNPAP